MPMYWKSPVKLENGLAEAFSTWLWGFFTSKDYSQRSIPETAIFHVDDLDGGEWNALVIWWMIVRREWAKVKEHNSRIKDGNSFYAWVPSVMFSGESTIKEVMDWWYEFKGLEEGDRKHEMLEQFDKTEEELQALEGFTCTASAFAVARLENEMKSRN